MTGLWTVFIGSHSIHIVEHSQPAVIFERCLSFSRIAWHSLNITAGWVCSWSRRNTIGICQYLYDQNTMDYTTALLCPMFIQEMRSEIFGKHEDWRCSHRWLCVLTLLIAPSIFVHMTWSEWKFTTIVCWLIGFLLTMVSWRQLSYQTLNECNSNIVFHFTRFCFSFHDIPLYSLVVHFHHIALFRDYWKFH